MECGQKLKYECPLCMKMFPYKHILKGHLQLVYGNGYRKDGHWASSEATSRGNENDDLLHNIKLNYS